MCIGGIPVKPLERMSDQLSQCLWNYCTSTADLCCHPDIGCDQLARVAKCCFLWFDFSEGFTFWVQHYFKMCFSVVPLLSLKTGVLLQLQHAPRVFGVGSCKICLCVNLRFVFALLHGGGVGLLVKYSNILCLIGLLLQFRKNSLKVLFWNLIKGGCLNLTFFLTQPLYLHHRDKTI